MAALQLGGYREYGGINKSILACIYKSILACIHTKAFKPVCTNAFKLVNIKAKDTLTPDDRAMAV